jgi:hypothetical protein
MIFATRVLVRASAGIQPLAGEEADIDVNRRSLISIIDAPFVARGRTDWVRLSASNALAARGRDRRDPSDLSDHGKKYERFHITKPSGSSVTGSNSENNSNPDKKPPKWACQAMGS